MPLAAAAEHFRIETASICPQDSWFGWAGLGINGFGRIGRLVFRAAMANPDVELKVRYDLRAKRELKS